MKIKYDSPKLDIEVLEKCDVLTSSSSGTGGSETNSSTNKLEHENAYGDFVQFVLGGPSSWF